MHLVNVLIFSKDRAAQLDALLRSVREQVEGWERRGRWAVVYAASTPAFAAGYEIVAEEHRSDALELIDEGKRPEGFRSIVIETMQRQEQANGAPFCMFGVDDMIFKARWPLDGGRPMTRLAADPRVLCVSLRLCPRYDYCYAIDRPVKPPFMARFGCWNWRKASGDWGYPMSLDGNVFRFGDVSPLVERVEFRHPNSLESALHKRRSEARPLMTCHRESIVVNLPINRVQHDYDNRAGEQHAISVEALNESFLAGRRVDLAPVYALEDNRGCHHEMPMQLVPLPSPRTAHAT